MNKLFYFFCFSFLFATNGLTQDKEWTLMVYLDGSDLETGSGAGSTDIGEMMAAGSTNNVNVIVLTGGADTDGWREIKSWLIADGTQTELDFQAVDNAMSNPENLTSFINWATINYPADKYMLDLWNHGMDIRGYGYDENTEEQLKIPQLKQAIENTSFIQDGNRFELLGFDACLMAGLEIQSTLQDYGEYFVGSEETEPGHGWNYTPMISAMENGTVADGADLGVVIVDGFKAQSEEEETSNVTLGVIDLTLIEDVVIAMEALVTKVEQESKVRSLQQARAQAEEYSKAINDPCNSEDMVDVGDMMKRLKSIDPSLATEADAVLDAVYTAVLYNRKDDTRPLATGISMFLPHNKLVDDEAIQYALEDDYNPIDFSSTIQDFIVDTYIPEAQSDDDPPGGSQIDDFIFPFTSDHTSGRNPNADSVAAIQITHANDLEQVQVLLLEEFPGFPDEFIVLGSTFADTSVVMEDGSEIFAYQWDEHWLGINGFPAYISDIHEFEVEDDEGNITYLTRVHIPAILNPDVNSDGREIIISYVYDEDFNITLESIVPEAYGEDFVVTAKERINLQAGDQVQLLYEGFNVVTDDEFWVIDDDALFTIENGNEDLHLEYDQLFVGDYEIGFVLTDHSQNDTIIFDSKIFSVRATSTAEAFADNNILLYPNPANQEFTIDNNNFNGKKYEVRLFDVNGRTLFSGTYREQKVSIPTAQLPGGYYNVELISGNRVYSEKLIIKH